MILVTGASANHFLSLCNLIESIFKNVDSAQHKLIVYDLGLDTNQIKKINEFVNRYGNASIKTFDYDIHPDWFDITVNAGEYAWKTSIIYDTFKSHHGEIILWMDAGNLVHNNLEQLIKYIETNHIHSDTASGTIKDWTHPQTIEYMLCKDTGKPNRNAACLGFNTKTDWVCELLEDHRKHCFIKECIAPEGSSRQNHRQDQSVFTILYYAYQQKHGFNNNKMNDYGYTIHNDVE